MSGFTNGFPALNIPGLGMAELSLDEHKLIARSCARKSFARAIAAASCAVTLETGADLRINADTAAAGNIRGLLLTHEYGKPVSFRGQDNDFHEVTGADLENMLAAQARETQRLYALKWQLMDAIDQARSPEELNAIDTGGWFTNRPGSQGA